ncbi:L-asparaginase [Bordetella genomosp. 1]|uniref:L-asparaginase n=1 Tax=Bordetella genomosp. 1 TaxID=1395607 RepID=A0A261RTP1_9BORD|nr:asparaginase [Bordetella genomosp. 1]MDQ8032148.1 asparaginase [Bordetella sp.]OZI28271.1 L-asparaginase [Bordetella genomosp. 1]
MPERRLPRIALIATGGTIAGAQTETSGSGYKSGALSVDTLLEAIPSLASLAQIQAEQLVNVGSQNMTYAVWHALARRVDELLRSDAVDGVVITHGTDTLEETAYFLSLVLPHAKPVVLVGAMRPATAISADGPRNIHSAVAVAASAQAKDRGPLVVMNDEVHYARHVQKMACGGVDAFDSPNAGRAGVVRGNRVTFYGQSGIASAAAAKVFPLDQLPATVWPRVDIAYACADMDGVLIDFMASHAQGIVLAGVGDGNATDAAVDALMNAARNGVAVVRSTRCGSGSVGRNIEVDDDHGGFIAAYELNPQKARVLLTLALMSRRDRADIQALFDRY